MRSYGQYCPISRASEILAERWVPIVVRNLLLGARTFGEVLEGAPGMSRSLLSQRLRELERAGVVEIRPAARGSTYRLTDAGRDLARVIDAMGEWAARWTEVTTEHADPRAVLWSWSRSSLVRERLPAGRVLARFDFPGQPAPRRTLWLLFEGRGCEVCVRHPGYEEDLVVRAYALAFARWHAGALEWEEALADGSIEVEGPPALARALPTWNGRSRFATQARRR